MKMIEKIKESKKVAMVKFKVAEKIMKEATEEHSGLIESLAKESSEEEFEKFIEDAANNKDIDIEEVFVAILARSTNK